MSDLYFLSFFVKKLHHVYGMIVYYLQIHIHIHIHIYIFIYIHIHLYLVVYLCCFQKISLKKLCFSIRIHIHIHIHIGEGGYVPQGLTTLPMLVITFFSLSIATFSHFLFILFWICSLLVGLLVLTCLSCLWLCCSSKNLSQEAMLLNTHTALLGPRVGGYFPQGLTT